VEQPLPPSAAPGDARDPVERAALLIDRRDADGPFLLHGLALLTASKHGWSHRLPLTVTTRLADVFPSYPATPALLGRIASSAAAKGEWRVARQAHETLATRYPDSPIARNGRVEFGEALYRTGAPGEARRVLEKATDAVGTEGARALLLLGDLHAMSGDEPGALAAYDRLLRDHPRHPRSARSLLTHARLLQQSGQGAQARQVLQKAVAVGEGEDAAEAAYRLGQVLRAEGYTTAAVEWYMTAAYVAEASPWARHALMDAAGILRATGDHAAAEVVNRRLARPRVGEEGVKANAGRATSPVTPWVPVTEGPSASPPTDPASARGYARPR
jgi:TolA-binding protein